ncbi:helix-turn-helix domain-containing protein [Ligilactobacillus animalis]|uniref:helix-turn-helix domain-containing protein n=1 Tax=Ligilactobacillus animalis TaxID=1605 RepID=UPI0010CA53D9|nr:helix-turn-helix transcriptional regulator [Ligilactobacillus animalis]MDU1488426.1 helix-turn-helix transcriptional regulator [Ligilactobacillus animalis]QCQ04196.1 helix-turn-helix transcriptional regulator [Ligilactobacillus animalis]
MNILYLKIKELADKKGVSLAQIERDLNFSNGIISSWKNGRASQDKLAAIADYFGVSTDYLLGRKENESSTENQENKDLKKFLEDNLDNGMTFGDGKVTEEDREKLEIALTQIFYRYHDEFKKRKEEKGGFKF